MEKLLESVDKNIPLVKTRYTTAVAKTVANTTTETSLIPVFANIKGVQTLQSKFFEVNKLFRVVADGVYGTTTIAGTLTIKITATPAGGSPVTLCTITPTTVDGSQTNQAWGLDVKFGVRTIGSSGTVIAAGGGLLLQGTTTLISITPANASSAVTLDMTKPVKIDLTVTWGTANASNTITCNSSYMEVR